MGERGNFSEHDMTQEELEKRLGEENPIQNQESPKEKPEELEVVSFENVNSHSDLEGILRSHDYILDSNGKKQNSIEVLKKVYEFEDLITEFAKKDFGKNEIMERIKDNYLVFTRQGGLRDAVKRLIEQRVDGSVHKYN